MKCSGILTSSRTKGCWCRETIEINAAGFLLGDKKAGPFRMEVEWIKVERAGTSE